MSIAEIATGIYDNGVGPDLIILHMAANQQLIATTDIKPNHLKHG